MQIIISIHHDSKRNIHEIYGDDCAIHVPLIIIHNGGFTFLFLPSPLS